MVNNQPTIRAERTIPLGSIKFIGTSTCKDDWFSLGIGSPQEADPLLNCVLKTELFTRMQSSMPGGFNLKISDSIEYAKKPGKIQVIKVIKDSTQRDDFYKSGAIHTSQGEPPNSQSRPLPKGKPIPAKPFTKGRLIRPGGPGGRPSRLSSAAKATPSRMPASSQTKSFSQQPAATQSYSQQPTAIAIPTHTRNQSSTSSGRAVPPPPPAAPPAKAREPTYRALYDFEGESATYLSLKKDDIVTIVQKENNGKQGLS